MHGLTPSSNGTVKENVAPPSGLFTARISPPWDVTMFLLMASAEGYFISGNPRIMPV